MKNLFEKITLSLILVLCFNIISTCIVDSKENEISKIENKDALKIFKNLNRTNEDDMISKNITKNPLLNNEFEELNLLKIENKDDITIVYNTENENLATIIAYNKNSDSNILIEANNKTGDIIIAVNDEEYELTLEGEDIILYSDNGTKIPVLITEYQTNINDISLPKEISNAPMSTFGNDYGPFYKTNKVLVDILGTIGTVGGVAALKIKHPLLGIISTVASVISLVGNFSYATLYVKYYQAYAINNPSYVRQTEYYYNYNNYTSLVKTKVFYFYSTKPY